MKKLILPVVAVIALMTMSFTTNTSKVQIVKTENKTSIFEKKENTKKEVVFETKIEKQIIDLRYICSRTCYYSSGELIGCTEWICTEELEGVTVEG